jgi:hypothetical protein
MADTPWWALTINSFIGGVIATGGAWFLDSRKNARARAERAAEDKSNASTQAELMRNLLVLAGAATSGEDAAKALEQFVALVKQNPSWLRNKALSKMFLAASDVLGRWSASVGNLQDEQVGAVHVAIMETIAALEKWTDSDEAEEESREPRN